MTNTPSSPRPPLVTSSDGLTRLRLLVEVESRLWRQVDDALAARQLPRLAYVETITVVARGHDIRPGDIATTLAITTGAASKIVDGLVRDGLLERVSNPTDRRSHTLTLTARGVEIYHEARAVVHEVVDTTWPAGSEIDALLTQMRIALVDSSARHDGR